MVGKRRRADLGGSSRLPISGAGRSGSSIYREMLAEAGVADGRRDGASSERPLKRRRQGEGRKAEEAQGSTSAKGKTVVMVDDDEGEDESDEDVDFQDVPLPPPTMQTLEKDSDEESDDEDGAAFEDVDFAAALNSSPSTKDESKDKDMELNLTAQRAATTPTKKAGDRRKPISKEERDRRVEIHKVHVLCLLSHAARRNHWCNDPSVQETLRGLVSDSTANYLTPGSHLPQFGQAESLKTGLKQAADMWRTTFEVTERGLKKARWAEDLEHLQQYELPDDLEACLDRQDFRKAATKLQGSRDVGAQLYCALLRSVGVRARLVCSLQPLAFGSGAPTLPKPSQNKTPSKSARNEQVREQLARYKEMSNPANIVSGGATARRRLGHPNAAGYGFEPTASPPPPIVRHTFEGPKRIKESAYPVYWVEVLDVGHQKWQPADPVVTHTFWKPKSLEPPITDKDNILSHVIAFEADGTAKDVTVRYAKAYAAKTRKMRVDGIIEGGEQWWRTAMKPFQRHRPSDLDEIERIELAGMVVREPMPRNVQDFRDHPVFALERHLRRHEVLVPTATPSGTVSTGSRGPLEKIYRRRDVRIARSMDKWMRLGREVRPMEIPAKWLPKKKRPKSRFDDRRDNDDDDDDDAGDAGVPVYTEDQTELYEPPPVRNGKVPKNKFGNVEVYVPSMIPKGGVHIMHEYAARAAMTVGVDYAPALTGFEFKGRQGTAVLKGIVVAGEYEEAIRATIDGFGDVEQQMEEERRSWVALKLWRKLLMGLRIRERIWSGVDAEERLEAEKEADMEAEMEGAESDVTEEFDMEVDDEDMGGGFLVE